MTESSYLERSFNEFKDTAMKTFSKMEDRFGDFEKKIDEKFSDLNKDISQKFKEQDTKLETVMDISKEHSFIFKHIGKLFWLIVASAISVLAAALTQLSKLV